MHFVVDVCITICLGICLDNLNAGLKPLHVEGQKRLRQKLEKFCDFRSIWCMIISVSVRLGRLRFT